MSESQAQDVPVSKIYTGTHPIARSQALSLDDLVAGESIITTTPLSAILLPSEKGYRCDNCFVRRQVQKCSGCGSYWYCSVECNHSCTLAGQTSQWKSSHKKICKNFNLFTTSTQYQALTSHEKMDAILLSHLLAEANGPFSNMESTLPTCPILPLPAESYKRSLYSRFGNNNFAIHSHLTSFAHGIFPVASRLFNHSCLPNAAAKYIINRSQPIKMEVVALRDITKGEEICISYLDPALSQTRVQILELTYGFKCICPSCQFLEAVGKIPDSPLDPLAVGKTLRTAVFPAGLNYSESLSFPSSPLQIAPRIPGSLSCVFNESYLAAVSAIFSDASHDGPYSLALDAGETILALYMLIYPPNYPQIGMHLLEMAKTAWNAIVSGTSSSPEVDKDMERRVRCYLQTSKNVLDILGPEGDEESGPLAEIQTLQALLDEDQS